MKDRMNPQRYNYLLNSLRNEAKKTNTRVLVRYLDYCADADHGVLGGFDFNNNLIRIKVYGNQDRVYILAILAHEIRHAQHLAQGRYADYYSYDRFFDSSFYTGLKRDPNAVRLPNLQTGLHAENDCNKYSISWLKSVGINAKDYPSISFLMLPYPIEGLANFDFHFLTTRERKLFNSNYR
jgi:hypothetical protein